MEFIACMLLASLLTGARPISDLLHLLKGEEPPHVKRARIRADRERERLAVKQARLENRRVRPGEDKPTWRDVARVYWGDAMADAIASHDRRRAEKQAQREENRQAGVENRPARNVRPSLKERLKRLAALLTRPVGEESDGPSAAAEGVDVAKAVEETLNTQAAPVIACDDCGATLIDSQGGHIHPPASQCGKAWNNADAPSEEPPAARRRYTGKGFAWRCGVCLFLRDGYDTLDAADTARDEHYEQEHDPPRPAPIPDAGEPEGEDMTETATAPTATGDAHDVESALHESTLLGDDLDRIDTALDTIDEAITSAAQAAERIEAFLASKSVDDSAVGGMGAARDHLSPERIKELMDAVAAAKQGVKDAVAELERLQELEQQLAGADGSVLNGR
jgi:hypothetical protein